MNPIRAHRIAGIIVTTLAAGIMAKGTLATAIDGGSLRRQGRMFVLWLGLVGLVVAGWPLASMLKPTD